MSNQRSYIDAVDQEYVAVSGVVCDLHQRMEGKLRGHKTLAEIIRTENFSDSTLG